MATPAPKPVAPRAAPVPRPVGAAPPSATVPTAALPSRLGNIRRQKLTRGRRVLFYGVVGVGKSTLAADAGALFADLEGGSGDIEASRYPFNPGEIDEFVPRNYDQVLAAVDDLTTHPDHGFPAFAIDTGDALEALVHRHLCARSKVDSIEKVGGGYGKGYRAAVEELRRLLAKLDALAAKGVNIIVLAHAKTETYKNPEGEDYDRFQLKTHKEFAGVFAEWSDIIGFVHFEGGAKKIEDDAAREKRARGWTTNRRLVELCREAAWESKWRLRVPMELSFELDVEHPWAPFADAIARANAAPDRPAIADAIITELNRIGLDEFQTATGKTTTRAAMLALLETSDQDTLTRIHTGLVATPTPSQKAE